MDELFSDLPVFQPGTVWLTGAGPGDPGLLTLFAVKGLREADVIVHDALVDEACLKFARPGAVLEYAGKRGGKPSPQQRDISLKLVERARAGKRVLRLKGERHTMLGLLPLVTSFAARRRHLGYRRLTALAGPFGGGLFTAHEFHYSTVLHEGQAERLFEAVDAAGEVVGPAGLCRDNVSGSYMHLIDIAGVAG